MVEYAEHHAQGRSAADREDKLDAAKILRTMNMPTLSLRRMHGAYAAHNATENQEKGSKAEDRELSATPFGVAMTCERPCAGCRKPICSVAP